MKWDTYNTKRIDQKYVYRYLTIEKLVDFLDSGELYLTRLDQFEDNLENISPFYINELRIRSKLLSKPRHPNPEIPEHHWDHLIQNNKTELSQIQKRLKQQQMLRYVSCWILSDVESFAMWDIYGKSGFVIRFEREYFQNLIRDSIELQTKQTSIIDLLVAGKVKYQDFNEMMTKEKESLLKFSAFRKHLSFAHESEYRIVGFTNEMTIDCPGLRYRLGDLDKLNFDIIANPRLNSFQFVKYKSILSKYSNNHPLKESSLKVWLEFRNIKYED